MIFCPSIWERGQLTCSRCVSLMRNGCCGLRTKVSRKSVLNAASESWTTSAVCWSPGLRMRIIPYLNVSVMGQEFENSMSHFLLLLSNRPEKAKEKMAPMRNKDTEQMSFVWLPVSWYCSDGCREEGLRRYYKEVWKRQKAEKEKEKKWVYRSFRCPQESV